MTDPNEFVRQIINGAATNIWTSIKAAWPMLWPWVTILAIVLIGGILMQIFMLRGSGNRHKLPGGFNSLVGSLTYGLFFVLQLEAAYLLFGPDVIDEIWFAVFGLTSFAFAGGFLRLIGFWYY